MDESTAQQFIVLFKGEKNHQFRGLYTYDADLDLVLKCYAGSLGPDSIDRDQVTAFFKYDSGSRTFRPIATKTFHRNVHAVALTMESIVRHKRH
jgi:hypothetical protein